MRLKKGNIATVALLILVGLYLFTPVGFHAKVLLNRLLSHNPIPVEERNQVQLEDTNWTITDLNGRNLTLNSFKGEVKIINFWATWCPPCIAEMPSFVSLYQDYKGKVDFYFVARDRNDRVVKFLEKKGYDLPVYFEKGLTPKALYYVGLPTTYIIDKSGKIVLSESGSANWNSPEIRSLLDQLLDD